MSKRGFKVLDSSSEEESDEYTDSPIEQIGTSVLKNVLQDYGFFFEYLQFPAIIDTLPRMSCSDISSEWSYDLGSIMKDEEHQNGIVGKKQLLKNMMLRIRRVQLLRELDVVCCLDHEYFSEHVLKPVYKTLERKYNIITVYV